jgi:hypothetical protein
MIPKQERGSYALFRLAKDQAEVLPPYRREILLRSKETIQPFFTNILQGKFCCQYFGTEFGLRVDSIMLPI